MVPAFCSDLYPVAPKWYIPLYIKIAFNPRFSQPGLAAKWTERFIYLALIALLRPQSEAVRHLRVFIAISLKNLL